MSQAVSAPITGACAFTGGKSAKATDLSAGFIDRPSPSRRALLAGMMLAPAAAALPAGALAAAARVPAGERDAKFWVAHDRYLALVARFDAFRCKTFDEERQRDMEIGEPMHAALQAMGGIGVHSLPALAAKMAAFSEFPDCDVCDGAFTAYEVMVMDVERMMVAEMVA